MSFAASAIEAKVTRRRVGEFATSIVVLGAFGLLAWWSRDPATRLARSGADELVAISRSTGLLAAYLILIEVALVARVPVLEGWIGADRLTRAHRWLGGYLFFLVLVHVVTVVLGYAGQERVGVPAETRAVVLNYPDVLMATLALALLAMVLLASWQPVRRRLAYETWHGMHIYAYLALALAFAHQFADGAQFAANRSARVVWATAHVFVALLVVVYRLAAPVLLWWRHRFVVTDVVPDPAGGTSVVVTGRRMHELRVEAGQFFRWRFLTRDRWWQAHPYSLSELPRRGRLRMTAAPVGDHSASLAALRPGVRVLLEGPYGALTQRWSRRDGVLLIAGGSGIAPLLALLQEAVRLGRPATLVYRVRDEDSALLRDEVHALGQCDGIDVHIIAGRRWALQRDPFAARQLLALVPDLALRDIYLCGPDGMVQHVTEQLVIAGARRHAIHDESFAL